MVKGWSGSLHLWKWDLPSDCWLLQWLLWTRFVARCNYRVCDQGNKVTLCPAWYCRHDYRQWSPICKRSVSLFHTRWEFQHTTCSHYTVKATAKQNQPLRSPKIWLRRLSEKTKIFKWPCWNGEGTRHCQLKSTSKAHVKTNTDHHYNRWSVTETWSCLKVYMTTLNVRGSRPKLLTTRAQDHFHSFKLEKQYVFSQ